MKELRPRARFGNWVLGKYPPITPKHPRSGPEKKMEGAAPETGSALAVGQSSTERPVGQDFVAVNHPTWAAPDTMQF